MLLKQNPTHQTPLSPAVPDLAHHNHRIFVYLAGIHGNIASAASPFP